MTYSSQYNESVSSLFHGDDSATAVCAYVWPRFALLWTEEMELGGPITELSWRRCIVL
jgi:hypothetical protein